MRISTAQYYKTNADQLQARQNKVAEVQAKLAAIHPRELLTPLIRLPE